MGIAQLSKMQLSLVLGVVLASTTSSCAAFTINIPSFMGLGMFPNFPKIVWPDFPDFSFPKIEVPRDLVVERENGTLSVECAGVKNKEASVYWALDNTRVNNTAGVKIAENAEGISVLTVDLQAYKPQNKSGEAGLGVFVCCGTQEDSASDNNNEAGNSTSNADNSTDDGTKKDSDNDSAMKTSSQEYFYEYYCMFVPADSGDDDAAVAATGEENNAADNSGQDNSTAAA